jgi:hypothetical protein
VVKKVPDDASLGPAFTADNNRIEERDFILKLKILLIKLIKNKIID